MNQAQTNKRNRNRGKSFEKKVADFLGFFRIPYSGSSELWGLGDVRDTEDKNQARYMGECKTMTPRNKNEINYIIKQIWLIGKDSVVDKAKREGNKFPFLAFTKKGSPKTFIVIRQEDFKMMINALDIMRAKGLLDDALDVDKIREQINQLMEELNNETNTK